jgi:hypothetical protein
VLAAYGGTHVSPDHLYRPLVVFSLVAAMVVGLIGRATHRWHVASFAVALALLAVVGTWELFWVLVGAWLFIALRGTVWKKAWQVAQLTLPLNALVVAWFVVASVTAVAVSLPGDLCSDEPPAIAPGPNVYVILLDGYPRQDSLIDYFDFDNRPFLEALADRGFDVAEQSSSPYQSTIMVVPTMMHMRPLEELLGAPWDASDTQHRHLWQLLNQAPVHDAYQSAGYTTYSIVSSAEALDWRTADVVLESPWPSRFEDYLVGYGILRPIVPFAAMDRAEILDAFTHLESSVGTSRRFVFAHIMSPHNPYVFAADGGPAERCGHECANHVGPPNPMLADRFLGQLRWLNGRVIEAVDHIVDADPEAIVILFSDHGLRRDPADLDEWYRTLFAARGASFADDVSTLDVFATMLR